MKQLTFLSNEIVYLWKKAVKNNNYATNMSFEFRTDDDAAGLNQEIIGKPSFGFLENEGGNIYLDNLAKYNINSDPDADYFDSGVSFYSPRQDN